MNALANDPEIQALNEVMLGSAAGGRRGAAVAVAVVRPLTEADLPAILNPPTKAFTARPLAELRHSHHQLARLLATGRSETEASLITGYSQSYISVLKSGQDFQELLAYYGSQQEEIFANAMEQLRTLGQDAVNELQRRMSNPEEKLSNQQVMDLIELALIKPIRATGGVNVGVSVPGGAAPGSGVQINVHFVEPPKAAEAPLGDVIEVMPRLIEEK